MSALARPIPAGCIESRDSNELMLALQQIKPGQRIVYHRGHLADDRRMNLSVERLASLAYQLALEEDDEGKKRASKLDLTQFRQSRGFVYVATGKRHLKSV